MPCQSIYLSPNAYCPIKIHRTHYLQSAQPGAFEGSGVSDFLLTRQKRQLSLPTQLPADGLLLEKVPVAAYCHRPPVGLTTQGRPPRNTRVPCRSEKFLCLDLASKTRLAGNLLAWAFAKASVAFLFKTCSVRVLP